MDLWPLTVILSLKNYVFSKPTIFVKILHSQFYVFLKEYPNLTGKLHLLLSVEIWQGENVHLSLSTQFRHMGSRGITPFTLNLRIS
jgi:hypothetical protein